MAQNPNPNNTNSEQQRLNIHSSVHQVRTTATGLNALQALHNLVNQNMLPTPTDNTNIQTILNCFHDLQTIANKQISPKQGDFYDGRE